MLNGLIRVLKSLSLVCEHRYTFDLQNYILSTWGGDGWDGAIFSNSLMVLHSVEPVAR